MAYTEPTVEDFLARYPAFDGKDEYLISLLLDEAIAAIDDSWIERDRQPAQLLWVAHRMTVESGSATNKSGAITSESFGPISRSYAAGSGSGGGGLEGSEYGRQLKALQRKNFPAVKIAGS